ncbi:MAG: hypothetical protein QMB90_05365 [Rubritalea sp.]
MKKRYLTILPAMLAMAPLQLGAQIQLEPSLAKISQKVDADGDFLQLNKFDGDIATLIEYGELALDIAKIEVSEIPANLQVAKIFKVLGLDAMKASALSSKKVDGSWNNKSYLYTGGSDKGILSMYGETDAAYVVTNFAPETTDIAVQLRMDLRQATQIITEIAAAVGQNEMMEKEMTKKQDELGGMTPFDLISKLDLCINVAIDMDRAKRMPLPDEVGTAPTTELVARIDGAAWAWDLFGDKLIMGTGIPWTKTEDAGVITYTLPAEMRDSFQGYTPTIRIDKAKNFIWMASKESVLATALNASSKKLKDGVDFKATMASLPSNGNSLLYISKDVLNELVFQYDEAGKKGLLDDKDFKMVKPLMDKLITDLTTPKSGIAAVLAKDNEGIFSALRAPFPVKNYLNQLSPLFSQAAMFGAMNRRVMPIPNIQ